MSEHVASNDDPYALIPELGDLVTFESNVLQRVTGRIVFRDESLIRIRPFHSSSNSVEYPLQPETGLFLDSLGMTKIVIHEKRKDPHFSKQLSVLVGESLEYFDAHGAPIDADKGPHIVFEVIATEEYDAIKLNDGTILDFQFCGPPAPIAVIRPRAAPEDIESTEDDSIPFFAPPEESVELFPEIDVSLLPAALVQEIPSEERIYVDSVQREDMFVSLLNDIPKQRQKDPKVMQELYRRTDLLLALKNSVVSRDADGAVDPTAEARSYIATTVQEALEKQSTGAPLAALIPVAAVKKVLYTDDGAGDRDDTESRSDIETLVNVYNAINAYSSSSSANAFIAYMNSVLNTICAYTPAKEGQAVTRVDQDVLRSQIPPAPVEGFAAFGALGEDAPLTADYLTTIKDRTVRLLSANYIRDEKTSRTFRVAPADTAETVGHIILTENLAALRSPIKSSVLLWDIQASMHSRNRRRTFYTSLLDRIQDQIVVHAEDSTSLVEQLTKRLEHHRMIYSFLDKTATDLYDSFGLRNLELTAETIAPLVNTIHLSHEAWNSAYTKLQTDVLQSLAIRAAPPVQGIVSPEESGLFSASVMANPNIAAALQATKTRAALLANYDLALANDILAAANATLGPYWYALASESTSPETLHALESTYVSEVNRMKRNTATTRTNALRITAAPTINRCPHVHEYETIRGVRNDQKRMILFERFMNKYQSGHVGNWTICGMCNKDLVCRHEVLLLNEYMNPGRGAALHKALLLEYAGPVFEGAYICKTCGQKIQDIEYDTHLEFDDEGRPLVGRSIVATADAEEEDNSVAVDTIPFKEKNDRLLYFHQRTLLELCGMALDMDTYIATVAAANIYIHHSIKSKQDYEALQKKLQAAKKPIGPTYDVFFNTKVVGVIGALGVLELQTSPISIPIAAPGCKLDRRGFPLDGLSPDTAGMGAVEYVACALAHIMHDDVPWNKASWSTETNMGKRVEDAKRTILSVLYELLAIPIPVPTPTGIMMRQLPPIEGVTERYKELLDKTRKTSAAGAIGDSTELPSRADRLPPSFRPLSLRVEPSVIEEIPIGNRKQFEANVAKGDIVEIGAMVQNRQIQMNHILMSKFHEEGTSSGMIKSSGACSESVCCFTRLSDIAQRGFGINSLNIADAVRTEMTVISNASSSLQRRNPAAVAAGTHIYVPWSAPTAVSIMPAPDSTVYYKLFLKHCFRERNYGSVHEFGSNFICRHCEFAIPEEFAYAPGSEIGETDSKRRETAMNQLLAQRTQLATTAFATQGVQINEQTFHDLENAIRTKKTIPAILPSPAVPFLDRLRRLGESLARMLPEAVRDWDLLVGSMTNIMEKGLKGVQRLSAFSDVSRRYDTLRANIGEVFSQMRHTPKVVADLLQHLDAICSRPEGGISVRNLQAIFVVGGEQVARDFQTGNPPSRKWFPKINRNHAILLNTIWETMSEVTTATHKNLADVDDESVVPTIRTALERFTAWFGEWLHVWREEFRPDNEFTAAEFTLVLKWSLFAGLRALVTPSSALYADAPSVAVAQQAADGIANWILLSAKTAQSMIRKYQLTPQEIKEQVDARLEKEKQMFIRKLDVLEPELKKLEKMKKKLKIGDWSVGTTRNLFSYDPEMFEFERSQRAAMGVPEHSADVVEQQAGEESAAEAAGFYVFGEEETGMAEGTMHRATQDEDEEGGGGGSGSGGSTEDMHRITRNTGCSHGILS